MASTCSKIPTSANFIVGESRTLNRLGQGQQRLTLNLCDEHYEKVRKGDMGREFINWLVAIVWPRPGFDRLSHAA